jgi:hypothetical protein
MPKGKPTRAKAKRAPKKYSPPLAGPGSPTYDELRQQLQSLFRGFYNAQDAISVCRMALERNNSAEDCDVANVLGSIVHVRIDHHLRLLARLTKSVGGSTVYDDDNAEIDVEAYGDVAEEGGSQMSETAKTPLLAVNEQVLAFRKRLEGIFDELHIVLDVSIVCYTVAGCLNGDCNPELSTLIRHHVMMGIDEQMGAVSRMVEALGGETEYTEEERPPSVPA